MGFKTQHNIKSKKQQSVGLWTLQRRCYESERTVLITEICVSTKMAAQKCPVRGSGRLEAGRPGGGGVYTQPWRGTWIDFTRMLFFLIYKEKDLGHWK